jgi:hypothetical protein
MVAIIQWNPMYTSCCSRLEYRDIVKASGENGYAALHNILLRHHPRLTEKKVESKIPSQGITTRFGHHMRAIQERLFREDTHGRMYSK